MPWVTCPLENGQEDIREKGTYASVCTPMLIKKSCHCTGSSEAFVSNMAKSGPRQAMKRMMTPKMLNLLKYGGFAGRIKR